MLCYFTLRYEITKNRRLSFAIALCTVALRYTRIRRSRLHKALSIVEHVAPGDSFAIPEPQALAFFGADFISTVVPGSSYSNCLALCNEEIASCKIAAAGSPSVIFKKPASPTSKGKFIPSSATSSIVTVCSSSPVSVKKRTL